MSFTSPRNKRPKRILPDTRQSVRLLIESLEQRTMLAGDVGFTEPQSFAVGNNPEGLATADVNGDGHQDLISANFADLSVSILEGDGGGDFRSAIDFPTHGNSVGVSIADVNADDRPDIITANLTVNNVSVLIQQVRRGLFDFDSTYDVGVQPQSVTAADVDDDGHLDLIVPYTGLPGVPGGISLLYGDGAGRFQSAVEIGEGLRPVSAAVADLNADGHLDVAAANGYFFGGDENNDLAILMGEGGRDFADPVRYSAGDRPTDIDVADLNTDGILDLVALNTLSDNVSILLGEGDGRFTPSVNYPVGRSPNSLALSDLNGNGYLDIAVANRNTNDISILINHGGGTFVPQGRFSAGINPLSIVVGNFNDDQLPDLAVVTQEPDEALVLFNTPAETGEPVLLDGRGALYEQNFDTALGIDGAAAGVPLPASWSSLLGGRAGNSITQTFPAGAVADGTYNAGRDNSADRAIAVGSTNANVQHEFQFVANVTGGGVSGVRLAFDIEAWQADATLAASPGEAAFDVVLEADAGTGFQTVADFGRVTTGTTLRPPSGPLGTELWKTDGTNVSLVADIVPGEAGSTPGSFAVYNDALYFVAGEGDVYKLEDSQLSTVANLGACGELCPFHLRSWVLSDALYYDVLSHDRRRVNDQLIARDMLLRIGENSATRIPNVERFRRLRRSIVFNDELYFVPEELSPPEIGRELWKLQDGTAHLIADINPRSSQIGPNHFSYPDSSSDPREFTLFDETLYFTAGTMLENEVEIFRTDGSKVEQVTDILPLRGISETWCGSCAANLTVVGEKLFFEATDDFDDARTDGFSRSLWTFDGTTVTKVREGFIADSPEGHALSGVTLFKGELYFAATDEVTGSGLWRSDGTTATRVDINPGSVEPVSSGWKSPSTQPAVFRNEFYFAARDATGGFAVWKTDGNAVSKLPHPNPNGDFLVTTRRGDVAFPNFTVVENELYFLANDGRTGTELWKTDGTNVVRVTDVNSGPGDSFDCLDCRFTEFNGELYFSATNGDGLSAVMDGDAPPNRIQFDSNPISADIPAGATIRLRFSTPAGDANVGYVVGLDNVQFRLLAAGDSDGNGQFDQNDIVVVLQANKYLTGQPATFTEGDWNRDGRFDQRDIVAALQTNNYLQGPYALLAGEDESAELAKNDECTVDEIFHDDATLGYLLWP